MKTLKFTPLLLAAAIFAGCSGNQPNANTAPTIEKNASNNSNAGAMATAQNLTEVPRPQSIVDKMKERGAQDEAQPTLKIVEPRADLTVNSSVVKVRLELSGDLKGYKPMKDTTTGMGNHIHVVLDNQPYEAYYNLDEEFELRNVADGEHTLRVFPSRPWHESYKTEGAFKMVKFAVKNGGGDATKPTVTNSGGVMANANANTMNANAAAPPTPEGKDVQSSTAGAVDAKKPLLTYSRPKGEYKGADADAVMIDFWLSNAKLSGDGGEYKVRYSVDGGAPKFLEKWQPVWLTGWASGKHKIKLELVDKNGNSVENGGYNATEREITITK